MIYKFVITGTLNATVEAENLEDAAQTLEDHLESYSPVGNWEFEETPDLEFDSTDIKLKD